MAVVAFKLLVLKTPRLEAMQAFYEALGLSFQSEQHGNGPVHFATQVGDLVLELYPLPEGGAVDRTTRLGFQVADPDAFLERAPTLGGDVLQHGKISPWGYRAVVADPDGRRIELYRFDCEESADIG